MPRVNFYIWTTHFPSFDQLAADSNPRFFWAREGSVKDSNEQHHLQVELRKVDVGRPFATHPLGGLLQPSPCKVRARTFATPTFWGGGALVLGAMRAMKGRRQFSPQHRMT